MKFEVEITADGKKYRIFVERVNVTEESEQFIIQGPRGKRRVVIESDRPYFRNNRKAPQRYPMFKLIEGDVLNMDNLEKVFFQINNYLDFSPLYPAQSVPSPIVVPKKSKKEKGEGNGDDWGTRRKV